MKSINNYILENKYKSEKEIFNIFFKEIINQELFKNSIGKLSNEYKEDFIFIIYNDIINWGFDIPSVGNRIIQRKKLWDELKKYIDGYDLSNMIKVIYKEMQK